MGGDRRDVTELCSAAHEQTGERQGVTESGCAGPKLLDERVCVTDWRFVEHKPGMWGEQTDETEAGFARILNPRRRLFLTGHGRSV